MRDHVKRQLLPVLILIIIVSKQSIQFSDFGVDFSDILSVRLDIEHGVEGHVAIEENLFGIFTTFFVVTAGTFRFGLALELGEFWLLICLWEWGISDDSNSSNLILNTLKFLS